MNLTLYAPKSHINAGSRVEIAAKFLEVPLEFNRIPFTEIKTPEYMKKHPLGKIPVLETPEGCIFESMSIIRYLARKAGKMYGSNPAETAQVDQWFEFIQSQLYPTMMPMVIGTMGYRFITKEQYDESKKQTVEILKNIDAHLNGKEFLALNQLTLADVVLGNQLRYPFCLTFDEATRANFPNLTKWFSALMEHPTNVKHFGKTWLCQKEFVPDFEFLKTRVPQAPKKEEKKKEAPKKEAPKKEKKKEE